MARLTYATFALLAFAAACGSKNGGGAPDAPVVMLPDAPPPPDAMPDALVCNPPQMMCTPGSCTDTTTDESNCGSCGMVCQGGAFCGPMPTNGACQCPTDFVPDTIATNALLSNNAAHLLLDVAPFAGTNGPDAFVLVTATAGTTTGNFTFTGGLTPPIVALAYNLNLASQSADSYFVAVSGKMNISTFTCNPTNPNIGSEIKGTLTNVKFQGATGSLMSMNLMVDPNGCTFTVPSLSFDITSSTACTP
jgi:hypothetical protein